MPGERGRVRVALYSYQSATLTTTVRCTFAFALFAYSSTIFGLGVPAGQPPPRRVGSSLAALALDRGKPPSLHRRKRHGLRS